MTLHGKNIIAGEAVSESEGAVERFTSRMEGAEFDEATAAQIDRAVEAAEGAFDAYRRLPAADRAAFLERIGVEIEALGDDLLTVANQETSLPIAERLAGERGRTVNQLRMFAALIREGTWVEARIDRAMPDRKPVPKPDLRRMLLPLGPVAVFGASNFPLAFSVAGGDTASALAAGCPVVVKAHPAHPATSELVAGAIAKAARETGMPAGVFSMLHSTRNEMAVALVKHPLIKAVGFTGSLRGGRALFDAASSRPDPIPVYAEMGSVNPVFLLPGALQERAETLAEGLKNSVTLGVGQFCTCPGLAVGVQGERFTQFSERLKELIAQASPGPMLYAGILQAYDAGVKSLSAIEGVQTFQASATGDLNRIEARPSMFVATGITFFEHPRLQEEVFGPSTVVVGCDSRAEMERVARSLEGHLTVTIHGTDADLAEYASLVEILERKAGRLVFNGFPTGVEVCPSMQHGGPYPATTDSRTTSVGTAAISRFARPVAYQNFPQAALPAELRNDNPRGIWRLVDGQMSCEAI
ncbi:MAG: aldehyde dehydrogenase (NADP(+)) [Blastocatellia bacterium]|nr:aldehyde dehydrogenase (NADP(+)) [Blastocatellia bacterium]